MVIAVLQALGFVAYWLVGVVVITLADRVVHDRPRDRIDIRKPEHVWMVVILALIWPVGILVLIAFAFERTARALIRKIQGVDAD